MKTRILVVFTFLFLAFSVFATPKIIDTNNILTVADKFLIQPSFGFSFGCEDWVIHANMDCEYTCDAYGCERNQCNPYITGLKTIKCSNDDVAIQKMEYGQVTGEFAFTKAEYEAINGNVFRYILENQDNMFFYGLGSTHTIELYSYNFQTRPVGAHLEQVINIEFGSTICAAWRCRTNNYLITLAKGLPFIAQFVELNLFPDLFPLAEISQVASGRYQKK